MRNIKLTIAYDGADFHGWQTQPGVPTIQGALNDAARKITQEKIVVHGASRTDAGVHALGQVAHFRTQSALSATKFSARSTRCCRRRSASSMPRKSAPNSTRAGWRRARRTATGSIAGASCRHSNIGARCTIPGRSTRTRWPPRRAQFEGEHDFTSFAASSGSEEDDRDRNMVRVIYSSEIVREPEREEIAYVVRGQSFLRYMVRKIVGTLIEVGKGRLTPEDIPRIFELRDRSQSGPTMPPEGLYLVSLEHPDPTDSLASVASRRTKI